MMQDGAKAPTPSALGPRPSARNQPDDARARNDTADVGHEGLSDEHKTALEAARRRRDFAEAAQLCRLADIVKRPDAVGKERSHGKPSVALRSSCEAGRDAVIFQSHVVQNSCDDNNCTHIQYSPHDVQSAAN